VLSKDQAFEASIEARRYNPGKSDTVFTGEGMGQAKDELVLREVNTTSPGGKHTLYSSIRQREKSSRRIWMTSGDKYFSKKREGRELTSQWRNPVDLAGRRKENVRNDHQKIYQYSEKKKGA